MTRVDIYTYSKDREIIGNHTWRTEYIYVRLGRKFFRLHDLTEINILDESNQRDDGFTIKGKISRLNKFKIRFKLVKRLLEQTK